MLYESQCERVPKKQAAFLKAFQIENSRMFFVGCSIFLVSTHDYQSANLDVATQMFCAGRSVSNGLRAGATAGGQVAGAAERGHGGARNGEPAIELHSTLFFLLRIPYCYLISAPSTFKSQRHFCSLSAELVLPAKNDRSRPLSFQSSFCKFGRAHSFICCRI